jgi:hypothetical protein
VRALLEAVARESGLRDAVVHQSYRVVFPAPARAATSLPVQASRRARSVYMIQGRTRTDNDDGAPPRSSAIIATLEGNRVVHIRRVHSR